MELWNYRHNINSRHIIVLIHEVGIHDKGQYFDYYITKDTCEVWKYKTVVLVWWLAVNRKMWHWDLHTKETLSGRFK